MPADGTKLPDPDLERRRQLRDDANRVRALRAEYGPGATEPEDPGWQPPEYAPSPTGIHLVVKDKAPEPLPELDVIDADELLTKPAPPRRWQVHEWLPIDVTLLGADGGQGKTTLGLQLAYATKLGLPWLGLNVRQGPAVYVTCEEPIDEVHFRLEQIKKHYLGQSIYPLKIVSFADKDAVLASPGADKASMIPTALFEAVAALIRNVRPVILALDAVADIFGGDEINRAQVRAFIRMLRSLCLAYDCAILLLAHPSVDGMKTGRGYSGSTHWNNAVRSRLYFTTPPPEEDENGKVNPEDVDEDLRELSRAKANRARRGEKIELRWLDHVFVVERGVARATGLDAKLEASKAKAVFLKLLRDLATQNRELSSTPNSPRYAPKVMAKTADGKALGRNAKKLLADAMEELFAAEEITNERYGRPSDPKFRIVEASGRVPEEPQKKVTRGAKKGRR
jgi:RecA-family ATPase